MTATALTLAWVNLRLSSEDIDISPIQTAIHDAPAAEARRAEAVKIPSIAEGEQALLRPLFRATRRPFQAKINSAPGTAVVKSLTARTPGHPIGQHAAAPKIILLGTSLAAADRKALLVVGNQGPEWVSEGAQLEGWRINSITDSSAKIVRNGFAQVLQLYPPKDSETDRAQ